MRTIERIVLPFEARSPLHADTKPESFAEGVANRQAIIRGSQYLGREMTRAGLAAIAYGSEPVPLKRTSHLMPRGSGGERHFLKEPNTKFKNPRNNRWGANYDTSSTRSRPTSQVRMRSPVIRGAGSLLVIGGRLVPVLGAGYVIHDVLTADSIEESKTYQAVEHQHDLSSDTISTGLQFGKSVYSSPLGKAVISVGLSKLGLSLF